jgi:hypothetical protein
VEISGSPEISDYTDYETITPIKESERLFFSALMDFKRDGCPPSSPLNLRGE